jgi:excinuclease ABC subunit C
MNSEQLNTILKSLPSTPGIYQYFDAEGKLLYVGKANNIRKRVASYFTKQQNGKLELLVRKIADIKYIVVETESQALLLENNLIKTHQPRYNVMLKDDKTYPWICIKNEPFPRIFPTRKMIRDGSQYFGPSTSVKSMRTMLEFIREYYPLRTCSLNLTPENIEKKKFKICLDFHLGLCKGPCEAREMLAEYNERISEIKEILRGNISSVIRQLKMEMKNHSSAFHFEKAQIIKEKLEALEHFQSRAVVVSPTIENADVFFISADEKSGYVNYLKVINGSIVQGHTIELKKKLDETPEELLTLAITEFRQRFESHSKEIIVPFLPDVQLSELEYTIPQKGDRRKLLAISEKNVEQYKSEKERQLLLVDPDRHTKRIMQQMMKDLRLKEEPRHIECFDNSNLQGTNPVAACVVFKDAKPSKKEYRHFNIKTVSGPDDFASMEEVVYRRYKRLTDENQPLPQLIVIDGGKGQLSAALKSLEKLGMKGKIGIISIAKKLEEIYFPGDSIPMHIDKKSETLRVIQRLRDEAHRFGITHHRGRRMKSAIKSELSEITGISTKTTKKLLSKFKSVKRIKELSEEELSSEIGKSKGKMVFDYFHSSITND